MDTNFDPTATLNLMRPREVADCLSVSDRTLANWRHRGYGPVYIKVGSHVRYPRSAVVEWAKENRHSGTHEYCPESPRVGSASNQREMF